jgi:hypothetical protein
MKQTRTSVVKERVERSRALRKEMDRSGDKVVRGLRGAAASIRSSKASAAATKAR